LPGLANFIGEFLVLLGTYHVSYIYTAIAVLGLIVSVIYALMWMHRIFQGPSFRKAGQTDAVIADCSGREALVLGVLVILLLWLGLYPHALFQTVGPALDTLRHLTGAALSATA
jgi:NADH-quinone oxidoreductase subunit M